MKPIEEGLEGMIESGRLPDENSPVGAYLKSNPAAREEVTAMMDFSRLIRENFVLNEEEREAAEPGPGFYSRVLARIDARAVPPSIWNFFLEPFSMRLVYASLTLAALLFAATFIDNTPSTEAERAAAQQIPVAEDTILQGATLASSPNDSAFVESANPDENRGAALMQLTTYDQ